MAEAPHGTAPALEGKDVANPMAMVLACARGAALTPASAARGRRAGVAPAIYEASFETAAGGASAPPTSAAESGTTEVCEEIAGRVTREARRNAVDRRRPDGP